ncbi:restriction endonuclease subunit S [Ideonella sp. DXS22W]|uniref:Restriction endonuclease subunit S n=1 Tax=Pseudaquabacterium inlustre TaxID=2984192 RepID=A0ABU9CNC4_9BURK
MSPAPTRRLRDLCELISIQVDPAATPNAAYVGLEHVPSGRFWTSRQGLAQDAQSSKFEFAEGDVLYGKLRPYLDKAVIAASTGVCTTELLVLRPRPGVPSTYLAAVVHAPDFTEHAMSGVTGAHHPRTSWHHISDFDLPGHSIDQQQRIGSVLTRVQRLIECVEIQSTTALDIKSHAMSALFRQGLVKAALRESEIGQIPSHWQVLPLGSLGRVGNGSTPKRTVGAYWNGGHYPWLTSAKVYDRDIIRGDEFVTDTALRECHLPKVQPGALLMAITGQGKTLGHCAVLRTEATVSQHVAYVQTDTTRANPAFLRGYLETQYDYLRQVGAGGGSTKGALTCAFLRSLPVPLPPLDEQNEIAEILDAIDAKIALHQQKRAVLQELFKALLHKLMTGEIDVNDLDLSALDREVEVAA